MAWFEIVNIFGNSAVFFDENLLADDFVQLYFGGDLVGTIYFRLDPFFDNITIPFVVFYDSRNIDLHSFASILATKAKIAEILWDLASQNFDGESFTLDLAFLNDFFRQQYSETFLKEV